MKSLFLTPVGRDSNCTSSRSPSVNTIGFPTQGEVIQFIFDAFGVLPRKVTSDAEFNETRKKSTQTALQRLAEEKGALDPKFAEMVRVLSYLVAGDIPERVCLALGEILFDLFEIYRHTLRDEGTFLSKSGTAQWFLLGGAVTRLPISVAKHIHRYNLAAAVMVTPDDAYWYLPTMGPDGWIWPLEKTMRWAYQLAGTSGQKFHWPDDPESSSKKQNLDSSKNWLAGRNLPSWPALLKNFNESFDALDQCKDVRYQRTISNSQKESIRVALFAARACTSIAESVLGHFGNAVLQEFCSRYRIIADCVGDEVQSIRDCVQQVIAQRNLSPDELDSVWFGVSTDYWSEFSDKASAVIRALSDGTITRTDANVMALRFGRLAALPIQQQQAFAPQHSVPSGFSDAVLDGLALRKSVDISTEKIEAYAVRLDSIGLRHLLPWMVPWQVATFFYRAERYEDAYPFIKEAFQKAQYCAGSHQYMLLNQYIELSAKNNQWRDFNRGVEWATYLGFEVRMLRQQERTKENLRSVFEFMQKTVWAI